MQHTNTAQSELPTLQTTQRAGTYPLCLPPQPGFSMPGDPLALSSPKRHQQLLGAAPTSQAFSNTYKTHGSKRLKKNLLCSRTGIVMVPPKAEVLLKHLSLESIKERCLMSNSWADTVDTQPTPPPNCPEDKELEVYSLTPKIQDSFVMLNNSGENPVQSHDLPSATLLDLQLYSSVFHATFPTSPSTHQHIKAPRASQHPGAGSPQAIPAQRRFDR